MYLGELKSEDTCHHLGLDEILTTTQVKRGSWKTSVVEYGKYINGRTKYDDTILFKSGLKLRIQVKTV